MSCAGRLVSFVLQCSEAVREGATSSVLGVRVLKRIIDFVRCSGRFWNRGDLACLSESRTGTGKSLFFIIFQDRKALDPAVPDDGSSSFSEL